MERHLRCRARQLRFRKMNGSRQLKLARESQGEAGLEVRDRPERWALAVGDGEVREVLLVRYGEEFVGACDCQAFRIYRSYPCRHLLEISRNAGAEIVVPEDRDLAARLAFGISGDVARPQLPAGGPA